QAYKEKINVIRNSGSEKMVADIYSEQFDIFEPKGGDVYTVAKILDRYANRVQLKGAVFREANFALTQGLSVKSLISRGEGLKGDAYLERAIIVRTNPDLTTTPIALHLGNLMEG